MKKTFLVLFGTAIGVIVCEAGLFIITPPNNPKYSWGHPIVRNRYGFREKEFATPTPKEIQRIMVIGDSLTEGPGLMAEERFTALLQKKLGAGYEVLNFGVGGYDT